MHLKLNQANIVRAALIVLGALLGYAVKAGFLPAELATDLSLAAGVLLGTGAVQVTGKTS